MLRILKYVCLSVLLSPAGVALAEPRAMTLDEATRLAMTNNPEVRELAANVDAARARLAGASLLFQGNPSLSVTAGPRSSPEGKSLDHSVQLLQSFEIAGQRGARKDAASAGLGALEAQMQALRGDVAAKVRDSFGRALAAERRVHLAEEALAVAKQGVQAAEERFRAGAAALLEVNTSRVEVGRLARVKGSAVRRRAEAFADFHLVVGLDPMERITLREDATAGGPPAATDELLREALANRAELRAARLSLEAARAQARLAAREAIPSPRLGVSYTREEESDTGIVQGIVSLDLPLFHRNQAARGETAARIVQMESALEATDRQVRQDVVTALARVQAAQAAADGYAGDVVKAMEENLDLSFESYRAGKIDFLQLLIIRRQTLEARGEHIDVLEELNSARAQLERAVGRSR